MTRTTKNRKFISSFLQRLCLFVDDAMNVFFFNNQLHDHLRIDCSRLKKIFTNQFVTNQFTNQFLSKVSIYFIEAEIFFIDVIKTFNVSVNVNDSSSIFRFNADAFKNVEIDYDFHDWNYVKTKIILIENDEKKNIVIDIDVDITLKNENFIRRQKSDVVIRKMIFFIIVRDLDTIQHESSRFCQVFRSRNDQKLHVNILWNLA